MPQALPREWYGSEIRNVGVRREKLHVGRGALLVWALAVLVLLGSLLLYVTQGIQVIRMGYEMEVQMNHRLLGTPETQACVAAFFSRAKR